MKSNFNYCVSRVFESEGGYTNDPSDSGGPTNFGITIIDYRKYVKKNGTADDVKNMSRATASSIYKSKYWDALDCDNLPAGVDYTCFDYGVLCGVGRPEKALQRFKSLSGTDLIDAINNERTAFLKGLAASRPKDQKFLKGWLARVERVRSVSKNLNKDTSSGPIAGGSVLGLGTVITQFWHQHETLIISLSVALAVAAGVAIHLYKNKGK